MVQPAGIFTIEKLKDGWRLVLMVTVPPETVPKLAKVETSNGPSLPVPISTAKELLLGAQVGDALEVQTVNGAWIRFVE